MNVKIKKIHPEAVIPKYAKPGDGGMDLTAVSEKTAYGYIEYGTGLAFEIPENYVGLIFPRSSISNTKMTLSNGVGVLDSSYRGELTFRFKPSTTGVGKYNIGDRVGQIIILPFPSINFEEVDELSETERGTGGYGSTNG